jgi:hypothetical protein
MRRLAVVGCLTASLAVSASTAAAQDRRGISLSLSGGYGSAETRCEGCAAVREGAVAGALTLGWGLTDQVIVDAALDFRTDEHDGRRPGERTALRLYTLTGAIRVYPIRTAGLFVRAGIGAALVDAQVRDRARRVTYDLGTGPGAAVAVGYDIRMGRGWSLTPALHLAWGRPGDLRAGDDLLEREFRFSIVAMTVGISFQ